MVSSVSQLRSLYTLSARAIQPLHHANWKPRRSYRSLFTVVGVAEYKDKKASMGANHERISVLQLSASWCGPCRRVKPDIEAMSQKYPDVDFYYIDVEDVQAAGEEYNVTALPTFMFLKGDATVDRLEGAQAHLVEEKLKTLLPAQA